MSLAADERVRLEHALARARTTVESIALNAKHDGAGLLDAAQALSQVSAEVLVIAARVNAYERAERAERTERGVPGDIPVNVLCVSGVGRREG